ncbi:GLPGLI family protein [Chryseobacterium salivictor]|uniref:GLPGLI family protein n=1 Tax=Chryseobacterium salivictor TaxID=2547600 RepID=A0A4P6ZIF3_9FLAO|nr:GLPGLI family protein [Chryseobacterium salivictor]QBO59571.1 hypothetical protein NBC122_02770 [Chryseobacterium salivictor]
MGKFISLCVFMKKCLIVTSLFLITFLFGQKMSFVYEMKYRLNKKNPDKFITNTMILDFSDNKSIFRSKVDRISDSLKMNNGSSKIYSSNFENQFYIKKNLINSDIANIITNSEFIYRIEIQEVLKWEILSEKKKIGNNNCQKASVNYGGREWTAWFTNDISINDGPYIFNGLPGLIVSIVDKDKDYEFNLIEIKKSSNLFDVKKNTINIDWNKFEQLAKTYYENPNSSLQQKIKSYKYYRYQDAKGNDIELNLKEMNKGQQDYIKSTNNPIELNHRIDY